MGIWNKIYNYLVGGDLGIQTAPMDVKASFEDKVAWQEAMMRAMAQHPTETYDQIVKRTYDAVIPTGATSDWLAWNTSGSYEALHGWRRICYLARDLERNNPHAVAYLRDLVTNVLGSRGIRMQPKVKNLKGKNLNDKLNTDISDAWEDFRKKGNYDVTGQYTGLMADTLILKALARDGGCLLRLYRGFPNKHRFAVQLLEIDALDLWHNEILTSGNRVTTGVETDQFGKPVAYHLLKYAQADLMANNTVGQRIRVPASDIIHVWLPNRITEVRGVSWFAQVMVKMRMLDKFEEAAAVEKRVTASKMGYLIRDKDSQRYTGQGETSTGEIIEEASPGSIVELPAGVQFQAFDPGNASETYADFRMQILRTVASGLGDQYNSLANDLSSVNYSSARFGRDIVIEFWRVIQTFLIDYYLKPVSEAWLECTTLAGNVKASFTDMDRIQGSILWRPRGWANIDPVKDMQGSVGRISFGLSTRTRELAEEGLEYEEVMEELAREKAIEEKLDLQFTTPAGVVQNEEEPDSADLDKPTSEQPAASTSKPKKEQG